MSKESYISGFIKAAQANGVDPRALAKYASDEDGIDMELAREACRRTKGKPFFSIPFVVRRKEGAPDEYDEKSLVEAIADAIRKRRGREKKAASENGPKYRTEGYAPEGASVGEIPLIYVDENGTRARAAETPREIISAYNRLAEPEAWSGSNGTVDNGWAGFKRSSNKEFGEYMKAVRESLSPIVDDTYDLLRANWPKDKELPDRKIAPEYLRDIAERFDKNMAALTNEPPASVSRPFPGRWSNAVRSESR